jgi:hypothetical protein
MRRGPGAEQPIQKRRDHVDQIGMQDCEKQPHADPARDPMAMTDPREKCNSAKIETIQVRVMPAARKVTMNLRKRNQGARLSAPVDFLSLFRTDIFGKESLFVAWAPFGSSDRHGFENV